MWRLGLSGVGGGGGELQYPERPGEIDCAHYIRTGTCEFGERCQYNHQPDRQLAAAGRTELVEYPGERGGLPMPIPAFSSTVHHQSNPSSHQYPPSAGGQVSRPSMIPGSYVPGSYPPMLMSHGVVPVQGWSQYLAMSTVVSPGSQQTVQARPVYGISNPASLTMPTHANPYALASSSAMLSGTSQRKHILPERPGQPECQFFMKTGFCKYGAKCKYHHPRYRSMQTTNCVLSPLGFPLRPGSQPCPYYIQHGKCKFGATCKFDHPMEG